MKQVASPPSQAQVTKAQKLNPKGLSVSMAMSEGRPPTKSLKKSSRQINLARGLPISEESTALHFPENKADKVHDNLKKCSPWYQSIMDPMHGADCKIPDNCGEETGCLQLVQRVSQTIAVSLVGLKSQTLHSTELSPPLPAPLGFTQADSTSTPGNIVWATAQTAWDTNPALIAYAQSHRVVSAALYVQPECNLANCSGEICMFQGPMVEVFPNGATYDDYANHYGSVLFPLNSTKPMMVRWFPISRGAQTYDSFYAPNGQSIGDGARTPRWTIGYLTNGVPIGVTLRSTFVINYEFLPLNNSINILSAAPSPTDATEVGLVENWIASEPAAKSVPTNVVTSPPSAVNPSQEAAAGLDGFGMFTDVLRELVPIALEGITMLL